MPKPETPDPPRRDPPAEGGEPIVQVTDLRQEFKARRFGWSRRSSSSTRRVTALDNISFSLQAGSAVGLLGLAGSGKSTLIDLLCGEIAPTAGLVRVHDLQPDTQRPELTHRIGAVCGRRRQLWEELPLEQSLEILAAAHRLPQQKWAQRRAELVSRLRLAELLPLPGATLSPTRRIRGELAAALMHDPELLILDEPSFGLDLAGKEWLRGFLAREHQDEGRTVLLATADLAEVDQFCDRLLVLDRGRIVHDGNLAELIQRTGARRSLLIDLAEGDRRLDDVPGTTLTEVQADGRRQRLTLTSGKVQPAEVMAEVAARAEIRDLILEEPDLAELLRLL